MIPWLVASTLLHAFVFTIVGTRAQGVLLASWFSLVVAPALSVAAYPDLYYSASLNTLAAFTIGVLPPIAVGGPALRARLPNEARIVNSTRLMPLLCVGLILVLVGNILMYRTILSVQPVNSLNDLNVALSSDELPSLGIPGRLSRLALPLGVLAFACALWSADRKRRRRLLAISVMFCITLIGVRRATLFYELAFFLIVALVHARGSRTMMKFVAGSMLIVVGLVSYFGYVQVQTKKASAGSSSALDSGLVDSVSYVAGNMAYVECLEQTSTELPYGISLPFIFNGIDAVRGDRPELAKSFCRLPDGSLFNTGPVHYDLASDFGLAGVFLFAIALGLLLSACVRGKINLIGVEAVLVGVLLFACRENLFGSLDIIQYLILYPIAFRWVQRGGSRDDVSDGVRERAETAS